MDKQLQCQEENGMVIFNKKAAMVWYNTENYAYFLYIQQCIVYVICKKQNHHNKKCLLAGSASVWHTYACSDNNKYHKELVCQVHCMYLIKNYFCWIICRMLPRYTTPAIQDDTTSIQGDIHHLDTPISTDERRMPRDVCNHIPL